MKIKKYNEYRNISGIKLRELRINSKMSQKQVAEKLQLEGIDLTEKEISKIEHNNRLIHDFELFAFAKIFNVSADYFNTELKLIYHCVLFCFVICFIYNY